MQLIKKNGIVLFWAVLFIDCFFVFSQQYQFHAITKVLLIPILLFYIIFNSRKKHYNRSKTLIYTALICSWIGDILLLQNGDVFFIAGTTAFLTTHIFYSIFFFRVHPINNARSYEVTIIATLVVGALIFAVANFLHNDLPKFFRIPFYVYAIAIGIMAILAANIYTNRGKQKLALQFFIPGAALFILSDVALATFKFKYTDENFLEVVVMITYGYAQCFMAQGFAKYLKG